jgi:hypothetical protein
MPVLSDPDDRRLAASMRQSLGRLAAALGDGRAGTSPDSTVAAALDGVEIVIRGLLVSGGSAQLPQLVPSFVFLVAVAVVDQDRALTVSRRAADLIDETLG